MRTWKSRGQFFAAVAEDMRRILIDSASRKACHKHGGNLDRTVLGDNAFSPESPPDGILALNDALTKLEAVHPEFARIVKLRYFAGMNTSETAAALETSPSTVDRAWKSAKAWLHREMSRCMD